ncbi:flavodoxin domain-containing protein [Clostridium uliginosum]|uniref:Flavodoxin, short chain n=1 Tax=Clostridium uliginosum TaxID=119641 RepID=A0A1I1KMX5_9CLOT|nr:flavodoxin domain-containing protein [Clostridium uliginosum]SFC60008.1 flavodoxin, short chain [Clostridium uliginosum]
MKKVSIIYWSCGGNIEILANMMADSAEEAGADVTLKHVTDATIQDVLDADSVAFGSPAMDEDNIEQQDMQPFLESLRDLPIKNKNCVLFGTHGWIQDTFMKLWAHTMKSYGLNLLGELIVKETPTKEQLEYATILGKKLAQ